MSKTQEQLKVTQEKLPGSQMGLEIEISPERSRAAYEQTVNHFIKSAQIPGFRRGKVPRQVVLQRYGAGQLKAATLEELVEKTFKEAIEQESIAALGNFQLRSSFDELLTQFEPGAALTYSASIDIPPEATLKRYTQFQITAEQTQYDAAQVDSAIDEQRVARATLVPVEGRAAEAGDIAVIDFSGQYFLDEAKENPQDIEGGTATDFQVELSEGQLIPGFIEGIVGMNPDETKTLELQFPEGYFQAELAGKSAVFTVTLKEIKTKELPELDDDFVKEISEFETVAELRQFLEERYQKEAQTKTDASIEAALLTALGAEIEVDLPETLVSNEVSFLVNQMASRLQAQGVEVKKLLTPEAIDSLKDRFRDEAVERVKRTLALAEVAQQESLTVETEVIERRFQEVFDQLDDPKSIDRERLREVLTDELLQDKVVGWLKEHSEITLVDALEPEVDSVSSTDIPVIDTQTVDTQAQEVIEPEPAGTTVETLTVEAPKKAVADAEGTNTESLDLENAAEETKKATRRRTARPKEETTEEGKS